MAPEIANPAPSLNPTKLGIRPSLRPKIPSSDGLGEGCHGLRHNRSEEVEGRRDAAPAAMPRKGATTRQRSDDSTDTDDREQLVYRRTRQPGALHQGARLNEERASKAALFLIRRCRVDPLAPQAHDHVAIQLRLQLWDAVSSWRKRLHFPFDASAKNSRPALKWHIQRMIRRIIPLARYFLYFASGAYP